jgi:hypothetical protein
MGGKDTSGKTRPNGSSLSPAADLPGRERKPWLFAGLADWGDSANCNNRGWETGSELVVASFGNTRDAQSVAGGLRAALWAHHFGVRPSAVVDLVSSRRLWDTASGRHVCRYDAHGGRDRSNRPDAIAGPSDSRPGDPCCTLLPAQGPCGGP